MFEDVHDKYLYEEIFYYHPKPLPEYHEQLMAGLNASPHGADAYYGALGEKYRKEKEEKKRKEEEKKNNKTN